MEPVRIARSMFKATPCLGGLPHPRPPALSLGAPAPPGTLLAGCRPLAPLLVLGVSAPQTPPKKDLDDKRVPHPVAIHACGRSGLTVEVTSKPGE